jgi:phosphoglycolate phosphatase
MAVRVVIWDLDGTLLDTLSDLAASTNYALAQCRRPLRSREEVRMMVGNGVPNLIRRALGEDGADCFEDALSLFLRHYHVHDRDETVPYPGIMELLSHLSDKGIVHSVVSNKVDSAVRELCDFYFGESIALCVGDDPSRRKKPAPDSVLHVLKTLGVEKEEAVYVGDSEVDIETARNAGVRGIGVLWGFRDREVLIQAGAQELVRTPQELEERILL